MRELTDLPELWRQTLGDPGVCIAILDGPIDLDSPYLVGARLDQKRQVAVAPTGAASRHGTRIASLIFGRHESLMQGVAPNCSGISVPIFGTDDRGQLQSCSQLDLARAIGEAIQAGANVINVSGGEFAPSGEAEPILAEAVRECLRRNVLIVAAAGNDGCDCLHLPAAMESVLAVGAMDERGEPLPFSNWGGAYRQQGIVAPGILHVADPDGGVSFGSGTSYAAALVSGVVALLLSVQRKRGLAADPRFIRELLLRSALGCESQPATDCRRLLVGRLNISGALSLLTTGTLPMSESVSISAGEPAEQSTAGRTDSPAMFPPREVSPSACGCNLGESKVYALGMLGIDFIAEARLDSLTQKIAAMIPGTPAERTHAFNTRTLLSYLDAHPTDAAAIEWTLTLDGTTLYAIRPQGAFAAETYMELRRFLHEQTYEAVERISVPGMTSGQAKLMMGQSVPVIVPDLRGMYSWTTNALTENVCGPVPSEGAPDHEHEEHKKKRSGVRNFLDRIYHGMRNLGVTPQDRALNFAATNLFAVDKVYETAAKEKMELESVNVSRSPVGRLGSDCWDVELYFFHPERQVQTVRKVFRIAVDVSDTVPVTIGPTRSWYTR